MSSITCSNLSFAWPDDTPLFGDLSFTVGDGRTGLVAPNGAGKSTLLAADRRCDAGPPAGSVTVDGTIGYLPQTLPFVADKTAAEVLGVASIIDALDALAGGDAGDAVFAAIGDDWDYRGTHAAHSWTVWVWATSVWTAGSAPCPVARSCRSGWPAALLKRPDVLLLDEPTNNLDADARRTNSTMRSTTSPDACYSSATTACCSTGWTASRSCVAAKWLFYGGNFTRYEQFVGQAQRVAEGDIRTAEQQLKREKREMQQARERMARRASTAARNIKDAGLPKIIAGARKRSAQESAGRIDGVNASAGHRGQDATRRGRARTA